jgi:NADH dehydrogenase (ubiquinone) 1 alpha subcomplex subunit 9
VSGIIVTIFGASGFVASKLINRLGKSGVQVVAPFRGEESAVRHLKPLCDLGMFAPVRFDIRDRFSVENALEHSNLVINLLGRSWPTRNFSLHDANVLSAKTIAQAAKNVGIERFIHVSHEGVHHFSNSEFLRSKWEGEDAVKSIFPEAVIVRPCNMFGHGDHFTTNISAVSAYSRLGVYIPSNENGLLQPLWVSDFVSAMMELISDTANLCGGRTYDFGGPEVCTWRQLVDYILLCTNRVDQGISHFDFFKYFRDFDRALMNEKVVVPKDAEFTIESLDIPKLMTLEDMLPTILGAKVRPTIYYNNKSPDVTPNNPV